MRTRPASITTIVIAIGLALTSIGIARSLPYTFAGLGSRTSIASDVWAHGTAVSPSLVSLVFLGIFAAIAMRPTRGGRRAALWLAILAAAVSFAGLAEAAQRDAILLTSIDIVTPAIWAFHVSLIALILSAVGEARRTAADRDGEPGGVGRRDPIGEPAAAGRGPVLAGAAA
jgi:hypothetical protein